MQSIRLRHAQESDAPLITAVLHAAFEEYRGVLDPPSGVHHETVDTIRQRLHEGGGVLAWLDNQPVGCVIYTPRDGYLYFGRLSVLPEYRGQGIARALIESVEQRAVEFGFSRVQLNVRVALANMLNYYTRLGYRVVRYGTHEGYTQPTYVTMEKEIPSCPIL